MNTHAIEVRDLRKQYGELKAVDGVSFDIEQGETFALLGPNGAGKSTIIEILEGYRMRTAGDVRVLGIDPNSGDLAWKSRLGIVLQTDGEFGAATVAEILREFSGYYPKARPVAEVIAAVGLDEKRNTRASKLSGGQRRRLDVALAVLGRPELLFLDEPTTGFDPDARRQFWDLLRSLQHDGTTILLTTHYLDEAERLSNRAAIVAAGTLKAIGPIAELGTEDDRTPEVRWVDANGIRHSERTNDPDAFLRAAYASGATLTQLEVSRASLEDIYLALIREDIS